MNLPRGRYFTAAEMASHDGVEYPAAWALRLAILFDALDTIREAYGAPLRVVSGYRSPEHNAAVGGAKASQHMAGRAADICPVHREPGDIERLRRVIEGLMIAGRLPAVGGIGYYGELWIHVDCRLKVPSGHVARWNGTGFGSEVA